MDQSVEAVIKRFRERGMRITPQRRIIVEALAEDHSHPTAEEIYQRVLPVLPDISRTTVYNALSELVALHQLVEIENPGGGATRYDTDTSPHHHLFCVRCGALVDISHDFEGLDIPADEAAGYRIVRRQVTFYGYCPDCQQKESTQQGPTGVAH